MQAYQRLSVCLTVVQIILLLSIFTMPSAHGARAYYGGKGEEGIKPPPAISEMVLQDGIYLGAGLGYTSYSIRQQVSTPLVNGNLLTVNPMLRANGALGEVFAGYGSYFDWFYIAGELFVNESGANVSYVRNIYRTNSSVRQSLGVSILPGIRMNNRWLVYARLGYVRTYIKSQENGTPLGNEITTDWDNGVDYGLGIETPIYHNVNLRGEFTHSSYDSYLSRVRTRFTPSNNRLILGVLFHFG